MKLIEIFDLKKGEIVSIVGAGGKTTTMFKLAEELRAENKVLVTTTTKIAWPDKAQYDYICMERENFLNYAAKDSNGIYVFGIEDKIKHKVNSVSEADLLELKPYFDYILIEADGSKRKPLKGWNQSEPVICTQTTKTIGVLDITAVGLNINEENIHRSPIFCELTNTKVGDTVNIENIADMITNPNGLFKNSFGEKILYINKVENSNTINNAKKLIKILKNNENRVIDRYTMGSLYKQKYYKNAVFITAIIMASGYSKRMGKDKLLLEYKGKTFVERTIDTVSKCSFMEIILVARETKVRAFGEVKDIVVVENRNADKGISESIKLGVSNAESSDGYMFFTADQPFLKASMIENLMKKFGENPQNIIIPVFNGKRGNPVIFPAALKTEFLELNGDTGGKAVIENHKDIVKLIEISESLSLLDVDTEENYKYILKLKEDEENGQ